MSDKITTLHLIDGLHFLGRTASGHELSLDSRLDTDGPGAGPSPMEAQLLALGACGAMDVVSILRKMRQDIESYDVRLTYDRAKDHPRVYTAIAVIHILHGRGLTEASVRRAISLMMARYCPVFAMLHPAVAISELYEITDGATGARVDGEVTLEQARAQAQG